MAMFVDSENESEPSSFSVPSSFCGSPYFADSYVCPPTEIDSDIPDSIPVRQPLKKRARGPQRVRCFIGTLNNPVREHEYYTQLFRNFGLFRWRFQFETGENGTPHIQFFIQSKNPISFASAKGIFAPEQPHIEQAVHPVDAWNYCGKEDTRTQGPFEFGGPPREHAGRRTDLEKIIEDVDDCATMSAFAQRNPAALEKYKFVSALFRFRKSPPPVERSVTVVLYLGATGAGKTHRAIYDAPLVDDLYIKNSGPWWDNYIGQRYVVFDDFAGAASKISLPECLRMLDKWRYQVEFKGGFEWLLAETIVVTTNIHPRGWYKYKGREEQYKALIRRFHRIFYFRSRDDVEEVTDVDYFTYSPEKFGYIEVDHE